MVEMLKGVLPESGRAQMEVVFPETTEWMVWSSPDGTPNAILRRLSELTAGDVETISWAAVLVEWAIGLAITVVVTLVAACRYKSGITDKRVQWQGCPANLGLQPSGGVWKYGTCDCCQNLDYCLYGYFCLGCRLGDTYTMTSIGPSYMTYIHAYLAVIVIGQVAALVIGIVGYSIEVDLNQASNLGYYVANACLAYWLSQQRKKLRQQLGDPSPDSHCGMDFILYWFCGCCTAIQEARQVDEITNTKTKCFFQLQPLQMAPPPAVMGAPVMGAPVVGTVAPVVGTVVQPGEAPKQEQPSGYGGGNYGGGNYGNAA